MSTTSPLQGQWISVNDQLPTHIYSVLIWIAADDEVFSEDFIECGIYNAKENRWQVSAGMDDEVVTGVTHWMQPPPGPWFKVADRKPHDHPDVEFNEDKTEWRYR